ncbi:uncharacterized protein H6S33_007300 [Morchella sextelata]|uniref:uncharacterized protein n=1 Tax=Morchella sextelata TaxID=1174677 RepID=UPI001D0507D1|nr:uncharacterized protein H6S33_007300 [Morchella sextelata]KAH0603641.1 hypothetical protein H6S33_007300 [Morchella sextelata]
MSFFDRLFTLVLTRDQRERHSRVKWEKTVTKSEDLFIPSSPCTAPMTPSLSSSSSSSSISSGSSSPSRSRPGTAHSTSPRFDSRPEFRRHTSIKRNPISYDCLVAVEKETKKPATTTVVQPRLYPLPPLGPMEGVGKYRRSIHVSEQFMDANRRDNLAALQPLPDEDDDVEIEQRTGRRKWRTDSTGNRDTTTPPRGSSASPKMETADLPDQPYYDSEPKKDSGIGSSPPAPKKQRQRSLPPRWKKQSKSASPPVIKELENDSEFEDEEVEKKPVVRVQSKKRLHAPVGKRAGRGGVKAKAVIGLPAQRKKVNAPVAAQVLGASMETLVSGEE